MSRLKTLAFFLFIAATIAGVYYLCTPGPPEPVAAYSAPPRWVPELERIRAEVYPGTEPGDYSVIDEFSPPYPP